MSPLGSLLRPKSFPSPPTIAAAATACSTSTRLGSDDLRREYHTRRQSDGDSIGGGRRRQLRVRSGDALNGMEDVFIRSLVAASTCRRCSKLSSPAVPVLARAPHASPNRHRLRLSHRSVSNYQPFHEAEAAAPQAVEEAKEPAYESSHNVLAASAAAAAQSAGEIEEPEPPGEQEEPQGREETVISRKEYQDLVNTYGTHTSAASTKQDHYPLAPRLTLTLEQETRIAPDYERQILPPMDEEHRRKVDLFRKTIWRNRPGYGTVKIDRLYHDLPEPRLPYISDGSVNRLFSHFAWVEKRDLSSSRRFFALLEDALAEGVKIKVATWNAAIAFAGKWTRDATAEDVEAAIETWLRMEREGGTSATNVTFNILFDVAVKAGRFALADIIYAEMDRRKMELDRYFRTSKIYYAGRRGDAENVRAAFRELVAAGEIVDTAIMNCVILSLVRCGEPASAENVMGKMKLLHEQKFGVGALKDWRDKKALGRELDKSARQLREERESHLSSFFGTPFSDDNKKEEIQRAAPIAPDELSYRILIQWHAKVSGNLDKIREFLSAIEAAGHRTHNNVFFALFNGFIKHGGYAYTAWNRKSLEAFWMDYLSTIAGDAAAAEIAASVKRKLKASDGSSRAGEDYNVYPLEPSDAEAAQSRESGRSFNMDEDMEDEIADPPPAHLAPMEFRPGPIMAALAAFYKCAGFKRMLEVWEEVQRAWPDMGERDRESIQAVIAEKRAEAGMYVRP